MDGHVPKLVLVFQPPLDLSTLLTAQEESVISLLPLLRDIPEAFAADPDGFSATVDHTLKVKVAKYGTVNVCSCGFGHLFGPL